MSQQHASRSRRVLITGCSSGIGRATTLALAGHGHQVIATARDVKALHDLPAALRLEMDVCSEASVAAAVQAAGEVDAVINNAGVGLWAAAETVPMATAQALFETNVWGPMRVLKAVLPQMRSRGAGTIVQVSSVVGSISGPLVGHYAASKHALEALSEAMRVELAPFGIRVAIAVLGAVESSFAGNRLGVPPDAAYAGPVAAFVERLQVMRVQPVTTAAVGAALAQLALDPAPALRHLLTPDAAAMIQARQAQGDAEWEHGLTQGLVPAG